MSIKGCCTDLEYAIKTGDIIHNVEENEFHVHGRPSFVDDGDGYTDDMTETLKMRHCLFCGKRLAPPSPPPSPRKADTGLFMVEHICSNCGHEFPVDLCAVVVACPKCDNLDVEDIGASKTE